MVVSLDWRRWGGWVDWTCFGFLSWARHGWLISCDGVLCMYVIGEMEVGGGFYIGCFHMTHFCWMYIKGL